MKKLFLVLIMVTLTLSACSTGSGTKPSDQSPKTTASGNNDGAAKTDPPKKVTLNIAFWDGSIEGAIQNAVDAFVEQNPHIQVNLNSTPWKDYWTMLQTSLAGGSGPDNMWMNGPNFHKYVSLNQIKDLEPFIAKDSINKSNYNDKLIELYSAKGKLYGMPYFSDIVALYYNKELFDKANIPYPDDTWDWAKLREVAKQLTNKENGVYGYMNPTGGQIGYYNLIPQAGGYVISEDMKKSGFDSPEAKEAIQFALDMMYVDQSSPNAMQQMETPGVELFGSGKIAMFPAVSPNTKNFYGAIGDKLGVAPLPSGKQKAAVVHGISWVMNEKTAHSDEAWELMKVLTGELGAKEIAKLGGGTPAYKGTEEEWMKVYPTVDMSVFIKSQEFGVPFPISQKTAEWNTEQNLIMDQIFTKKISVDDGLKELANKMNAILATEE